MVRRRLQRAACGSDGEWSDGCGSAAATDRRRTPSPLYRWRHTYVICFRRPFSCGQAGGALHATAWVGSEQFDFAFIDGWHTFDHTTLNPYYVSRLVRVGGYIVTDDCNWPSVAAAISYYSNYPMYTTGAKSSKLHERRTSMKRSIGGEVSSRIPPGLAQWILPSAIHNRVYRVSRFPSMVAFKKIASDSRDWAWFKSF